MRESPVSKSLPVHGMQPVDTPGTSSSTLGIPGQDSPTGVRTQAAFRQEALTTVYTCRPRVAPSVWPNRWGVLVWFLVLWNPDPPVRGAIRPELFHTTLIRVATLDRFALVGEVQRVVVSIVELLQNVLNAITEGGFVRLRLVTPWTRSWSFAPADPDVRELCEILRLVAGRAVRASGIFEPPNVRELHMTYP